MTVLPTIVEATESVPNHGTLEVTFTIEKDGAPLSVVGKTVTATIRREDAQATVINAALESHAVTQVTPGSGVVLLTLTDAQMKMLTAPGEVEKAYRYLVGLVVVEDDYHPDPFRLYINGVVGGH